MSEKQQGTEQWQRCEPGVYHVAKDGPVEGARGVIIEITDAAGAKFHFHLPPEFALFRRAEPPQQEPQP